MSSPLICPSCRTTHPGDERFCPSCGMPLTLPGGEEAHVSRTRERARKVKPQFTEGELVKVAYARHQAEAELIQGILLEEGVPSMLRRSRGFDVPDMLAAGPRDVMVPASGVDTARDVLLRADLGGASAPAGRAVEHPARLLAGLLAFVALVAIVAWVGTELIA